MYAVCYRARCEEEPHGIGQDILTATKGSLGQTKAVTSRLLFLSGKPQ